MGFGSCTVCIYINEEVMKNKLDFVDMLKRRVLMGFAFFLMKERIEDLRERCISKSKRYQRYIVVGRKIKNEIISKNQKNDNIYGLYDALCGASNICAGGGQ